MTATLLTFPVFRAFDSNGAPLAGGLLYSYQAGTTTPLATYVDQAGVTQNTNPVVLDSTGTANVWLGDNTYKLVLKDKDGVQQWSVDNIQSEQSVINGVYTNLANTSDVSKGDALIGVKSVLSGGVARTQHEKNSDFVSIKDFGAVGDGVADDASAINTAANSAKAANKGLFIPSGTYLVKSTLDLSNLFVWGVGPTSKIQASSDQFDVILTTGSTTIENICIHGGWDGTTAGQTGNSITCSNGTGSFAYQIHLRNVTIQYSKQNGIYWVNGGYSTIENCQCNASGLHGLYLNGTNVSASTTTIRVAGYTSFSDCPNGYGVVMNECIEVTLDCVISEGTKGFLISGGDNRNINILNCYQENTDGGDFITFSGNGAGLIVQGCIGIGITIPSPPSASWPGPNIIQGNNLGATAMGGYGRILTSDSNEQTATSAASYTVCSLDLGVGTYLLQGTLQTLNASSGTITKAGIYLTTDDTDSGYQSGTSGSTFKTGVALIDNNPGSDADIRLNASDVINISTASTYYLRAYLGVSAGTVAYHGKITATQLF